MSRVYRYIAVLLMPAICLVVFTHGGRAAPPPLIINEVLVGNAGTNIDPDLTNFSSWIELHNTTGTDINLTGYKIESWPDGATHPDSAVLYKTSIPAYGYRLIWADETRKPNHAPFEMDMDGGRLVLSSPTGVILDEVVLDEQKPDVSLGRSADASDIWAFFDQPTPGRTNNNAPNFPANLAANFAAKPDFSIAGGRFTDPITLDLTSTDALATITYTTDGSRPTANSPAYNGPILLNNTTIVRARAWVPGKMVSPTVTHTYLFNIPTNLPVVSLVTDNANLFDPKIGIYVKGTNRIAGCRAKANWHQRWERPANIEFFEKIGPTDIVQEINQEVGLELSGNCSRNLPQKSFEIKARKRYGDNDLDHPFFADKPMISYKRLILRNAGSDNLHALLRDGLAQNLSIGRMDIDRQAYRPIVVYVNGQYWGLYDMREKADEDYVENNYGLNEEDFDMVELNGRLTSGSLDAWNAFLAFLRGNNPASPAVYAAIKTKMDVDSFMDYIILQTFVGNTDWPRNNTRWWDDHGNQHTWRWMLRDLDFAFLTKNLNRDMITFLMKGKAPTSVVFNRLWVSSEFRNEFAQRYAAHLNTTFRPAAVIALIDDMADAIRPEIPAHTARWGGKPGNLAVWETEVNILRSMANQRPGYARSTLRARLGNPTDAMLAINIIGDGRVYVAGAEVPDGYSGPHFRHIPMTLTAVPDTGQEFGYWQETGETSPAITIPFSEDTTRTAVFDEIPPPPPPPPVVINELHHTPAPPLVDNTYEFLELYNAGTTVADISGYTIFGVDPPSPFPPGTFIAPGEYIVVADTPATYSGQGYQVFDFNGGLSGSGETVTLIDTLNRVVDTVTYGVTSPWPSSPNAGGPSLSLLDPALDNTIATNWAASRQPGGSPGAVNFPPLPPVPPVVINEIHYNPTGGAAEFIELYNNSADPVALSGFTLEGVAFTFPSPTTLAAYSYLVIATDATSQPTWLQWDSGDLADAGETITLKDGDGQVVDTVTYDDETPWPVLAGGVSLSLGNPALDNSLPAGWAASRENGGTPGAVNFPPLPVVINEIHYNPPFADEPTDDLYEFIELYNNGTETIDLGGYSINDAVTITFPTDGSASLDAGGYMVIFRSGTIYTGQGYPTFQWTSGRLSDSGEAITLRDPFGTIVDTVTYDDIAPWPLAPDDGGPSLSLLDPALDNSEVTNWAAGALVGGTPGGDNFPALPLVINEIHYNPVISPTVSFEFIELRNQGATEIHLEGFTLESVGFTFPAGATISDDGYLVIGADGNSYGGLSWAAGEDLDDDTETIALYDALGDLVTSVTYDNDNGWPDVTGGYSLAYTGTGDNNDPANWAASALIDGSPGAAN